MMKIWPNARTGVRSRIVILFALFLIVLMVWNFENFAHSYIVFRDALIFNAGYGFVLPSTWFVVGLCVLIKGRSGIRKFWKLWITSLLFSIIFWGSLNHFSSVVGITSYLGGEIGTKLGGSSLSDGVFRMLFTCVIWICVIWPKFSFGVAVTVFRIMSVCCRTLSRVVGNSKNLSAVLFLASLPVWVYRKIVKNNSNLGIRNPLISVADAPVPVLSGRPVVGNNINTRRMLEKQDRQANTDVVD